MEQFNRLYPQEKVYLHFDNTGYFIGETIWFKAYAVRTDKEVPTDLSQVLYVELLNAAGDVVERRKVKLENGQGHGDIRLDKLLTSGFYEVRAYTRYMTNWGAGACFSRVFPVFERPSRPGDYSKAAIHIETGKQWMPSVRQEADQKEDEEEEAAPVRPPGAHTVDRRGVTLRLYPEGGSHVLGLEGCMAFWLTDDEGRPATGTVRLVAGDGTTTATAETDREGRGLFTYTPQEEEATLVFTDSTGRERDFVLPAPEREGCALRVNALQGDKVWVEVASSPGLTGRNWGMTLQNGGTIVAAHSFHTGVTPNTFYFSRANMPPGVSRLTVFDGNGRIWAERQVFIPPRPRQADSIRISTTATQLRPCSKVTLTAETAPNTTFSFSARDAAASTGGREGDVRTYMLLCSELRGYVAQPEYYFESDDAEHRRAADLLMLTQGWRRYDWRVMAGLEPTAMPTQPIEDRLYIDGKVFPTRRRQKTEDLKLTAYLYNQGGESLKGETRTDTAGQYVFDLPDCSGRWSLFLKAKGKKDRENFRIGIRRSFAPAPRPVQWGETVPMAENGKGRLRFATFEDTDTLAPPPQEQRHILLPTVRVNDRWVYENPRVAWETEAVGRKKAFLYYDCDAAVDRIADSGEEIPTFQDWLKERNRYFTGETYVVRDETSEADWIENVKIMEPERNPDYAPSPDKSENFKILLGYLKIGSVVIDEEYHIYKDGLSYDNRPIVWVIDNSYYSITGVNYNHPPNPGKPDNPTSLGSTSSTGGSKPELKVIYCRTTAHQTAEMPLFLDEVKAVYVAEDQSTWRDYIKFANENIQTPVTVFVYTHHAFFGQVKGLRRTYFQGYNVPSTFEMNDYSVLPPMEDFRRTLFWDPDVTTDQNGKAVIEFYNNSSCHDIRLSAEGITPDGHCVFNE